MAGALVLETMHDIPAGTLAVPCSGCQHPVFYVAHSCGVRMPVEVVVGDRSTFAPSNPDARTPHDGRGRPHLAHCRGK